MSFFGPGNPDLRLLVQKNEKQNKLELCNTFRILSSNDSSFDKTEGFKFLFLKDFWVCLKKKKTVNT